MSNVVDQPQSQVAEGKYVYCIIKSKEPRSFGPMGIGSRSDDVYTVHYEDLAAVVSNTPIMVYDPTRDEMFAAERGQGAHLNGRRVRVSEVDELNNSMLCTGFPYNVRERPDFAREFANFTMKAQAVRRDGSAAIDLAYVACGRFDGFWEDGLNPWDVAAGVLLIEEAGGRVTDFAGGPLNIFTPKVLASNGLVHNSMMRVLGTN